MRPAGVVPDPLERLGDTTPQARHPEPVRVERERLVAIGVGARGEPLVEVATLEALPDPGRETWTLG